MKINYLTPNLNISGGVKVKLEHCTRLAERGYDVNLVITKSAPCKQDWFPLDKRVRILSIKPRKLRKKLPQADILVANHWPYCQDLPEDKGKLLVPRQIEEKITDEEIKEMRRKPDLWLPNSSGVKSVLESQGFRNLHLVCNGVNTSWFNSTGRTYEPSILTQLNLKNTRKGGAETIKVLSSIHKKYPNLRIVGYGQRQKTKYGAVPDWMEFYQCGPTELPGLYRSCGIYFYGALLDGFANSVAEAMACGCVVVTSQNAGVPFANSENSFLYPPGNCEKAIELLSWVLDNWSDFPFKSIPMKAETDMQQYSWEKSVDQLEGAFKKVLA